MRYQARQADRFSPETALDLFVAAESGQAVLLAANPQRLEELGQFQAISGKTWNHPVLCHGRLFIRNGEELACYSLEPDEMAAR